MKSTCIGFAIERTKQLIESRDSFAIETTMSGTAHAVGIPPAPRPSFSFQSPAQKGSHLWNLGCVDIVAVDKVLLSARSIWQRNGVMVE